MKNKTLFPIALTAILLVVFSFTINNNWDISNFVISNQAQQEIKISGYSSVYPALKVLASAYEAKNPTTTISILTPTKSEATISGVKDGLLDIGTLSRELKIEEKEGKIEYYLLAKDALLIATHPSVTDIMNLTTEQLKGIYSGKIKNWKELGGFDAKIVVLDRTENEPAKYLLRKYYLGQDLKVSSEAIVLRNEDEVIAAIQNIPYSIGAFSFAYAISNNLPVNRLSLNGVEPSIKNIKNNKYQMLRQIGITIKKLPAKPVQEFVNFATSKVGKEELAKYSFVASTEKL
ncbi:MAG: substrate-binding domain-containing protein [Pelatocladus maniniholoensis HA4357-MV3]|jgi:phosphate transport system substrate-binding protein|uniref:Substrate-binding domain-containing protein n=1 Tax=Pelatocladus maniniholoensis HA4357-MV3 TaxID=1117104 RepID=A0A9E3HC84_9NOST|nr:substrate-binding domain-containing protein [Pelatocladus maniniholoensis HA4357-MV3]BAZ66174.1 phosphate transport system substrate-binding protein [Fischerella sp. NIES-4106]